MLSSIQKSVGHRHLLLGAFTNWLAFAATLLVGFFLTPYLVRHLGQGPYGIWVFVESILAYFTLFDMGIAAGVVRFVARYHASGDQEELNRLVSSCLALFLGLAILVLALGSASLPFLVGGIDVEGMDASAILLFSLLMLVNLAITLPLSVFPSMLDGLQLFAAKSGVRIASLLVRTIGTVAIMEYEPSLLNLAYLFTACNVLEHLCLALLCFSKLPGLRISRSAVNRDTVKRVKSYSLSAFVAMVAGRATTQSGVLIVGALLGATPLTFFAIGWRLVEFAKALLRTATNTLTPAISSLEAKGDFAAIRTMLLGASRWALYLMLPVQLGLIMFGRPFLTTWMGSEEYAIESYPAMVVLAFNLSLVIAQSIAARVLYGMGQLKRFTLATIFEAIVNVGLSLFLGWQFGLVGVALGMAIPNLIMNVWVIVHTLHLLQISTLKYVVEVWTRPLVFGVLLTGIWYMEKGPQIGWIPIAMALAIGLLPYGLLILILEKPDVLMQRLERRLPFLSKTSNV